MHRIVSTILLLLSVAACDPVDRAGTWRASDLNASNLDAMLVRPADRVEGRESAGARAMPAALAIEKLNSGKRDPLSDPHGSSSSAGGPGGVPLSSSGAP